jgi:hypothetical protein
MDQTFDIDRPIAPQVCGERISDDFINMRKIA